MRICLAWLLCVSGVLAAEPAAEQDENARWRRAFDRTATTYVLIRDDAGPQKLSLVERPAYLWARSGPDGGTYGAVYVWTHRGNAEAVACFWRYLRADGTPSLVHELHSLSPVAFQSTGDGTDSWKPKAGMVRHPLPDAPVPATNAIGRMSQMRALCRDFTAHSVGVAGDRTELRLLPQPLHRSQSTNPDVLDGGVFAFVCSVGTDPEVFLQLVAVNGPEGPRWQYSAARFSHMDLFVEYRGQPVWSALRDENNPISHNAAHTYWVFHQRVDDTVLPPVKDSGR